MKIIYLILMPLLCLEMMGCASQVNNLAEQEAQPKYYGIRQTNSEQGGKYIFCYNCPVHTPKTAVSATVPSLGVPPQVTAPSLKPVERSMATQTLPLQLQQTQTSKINDKDEEKSVSKSASGDKASVEPLEAQQPSNRPAVSGEPMSELKILKEFFLLSQESG